MAGVPPGSLGMGDDDMTAGVVSYTATPAPRSTASSSEPRRVQSPLRPLPCLPEPSDAAEDTSAYAETLEGAGGSKHGVPFYPGRHVLLGLLRTRTNQLHFSIGDRRGPAFLMDICEPHRSSTSNHCVVGMPINKSLPPEDLDYLRVKGAFTLPPRDIQDALVQCYFYHVHPFSPILDPFRFILDYENNRASLLLLWSMFVASASVSWPPLPCSFPGPIADSDSVAVHRQQLTHRRLLSFPHGAEARRVSTGKGRHQPRPASVTRLVNRREKVLYDANYETDKMTLIQSVFLMSHWYTTSDDRAGPWHWNGIAIGLAHTLGLHRLPALASEGSHAIRPFWRRLWWSIYCRETWLSLGQGRPMRISLDDSDTALPGAHDKYDVPPGIRDEIRLKYLPREMDELFEIWTCFVMLGIALGTVLSTHYRAKAAKPTRAQLELGEAEIRACSVTMPESITRSRLIASHYYQFQLYFQ